MGCRGVKPLRLAYIHAFRDRHGKRRHYFRQGHKQLPLPGIPGSDEFMAAYQAAIGGMTSQQTQIGEARTVSGTLRALIAAYLDCSAGSTSPFKALAAETRRTRRNILENLREAHGDKRVFRVDKNGNRYPVLTRAHVQRMVNQKNDTPFAQRNFLNTLHAIFKWALSEDRVPDDPTLGVTRQKIASTGYPTWSEDDIRRYRLKHALGTMPRLALELLLSTAARREDVVKLGPQHVSNGAITFEQSKNRGHEKAILTLPLHPDFWTAQNAMPYSKVVPLMSPATFLTTNFGKPFTSAASFGNWFRKCCNEAGVSKGLSAHGLRKATARRLAELGCSAHQIAAITGHASLSEVQRYTTAADQKRLAREAMKKLIEGKT